MPKEEDKRRWVDQVSEIQALAQVGLAYTKDHYDRERYLRLLDLAAEMMSSGSGVDKEKIKNVFLQEVNYATPKIDVRAFVMNGDELLFVKERSEGLWSLPGGWLDVGESPAVGAVREVKEESGYDVKVIRLLALWDKLKHGHPLKWPHTIKCFFLCEMLGGKPKTCYEISDVGTFKLDNLPPLSFDRVTPSQILTLYEIADKKLETSFD